MTIKHFIAPAFLLIAFSFWYCQKSTISELNAASQSLSKTTERGGELWCQIEDPGLDPTCDAQIRVRCISVAPGASVYAWEVAGFWQTLENGQATPFNMTLYGGPGGAYQQGVWYDIPKPLLKQYLLDTYCPNNHGNEITCIVYTGSPDYVTQWSMWVDIRSGNKITTYHMNGAPGIMTPTQLVFLPTSSNAYDVTDVDFLTNCSNMGAQGTLCNPLLGCTECSVSVGGDEK